MAEQAGGGAYSRRRLTEDELATWRAFIRAHAKVTSRLERQLEEAGGLTLSELDVLLALDRAPRRTLRMNDLASSVVLTKSGITRLVDRLEEQGFVARRVCLSDRRGFNAVLTARGRTAIRRTIGTHLRGVATAFADHIDDRARPVVRSVLERIAAQPASG
ncbi:MAG TPA: MarR family transcriptional regulator [Candidatus Limnocylindria bacterium]|nr:MarR family transcriptional regulator [Candidatus Limnocylindria bacterium]